MLGHLIPWKKRSGGEVNVWKDTDFPIMRLRQEFDQLWNRFLSDWRSGGLSLWDDSPLFGPRVQWEESDKEYTVQAELPGFEPNEIDVKVSGNIVTISAEHHEESKHRNGGYRRYGSFRESFTLPADALPDKIDAR